VLDGHSYFALMRKERTWVIRHNNLNENIIFKLFTKGKRKLQFINILWNGCRVSETVSVSDRVG